MPCSTRSVFNVLIEETVKEIYFDIYLALLRLQYFGTELFVLNTQNL
jgi:hypothetical protein